MELGESNAWHGATTTIIEHVDANGAVRGRSEEGGRGGPVVSHLPSNVTSIYSDDYPRADSPHLMHHPANGR